MKRHFQPPFKQTNVQIGLFKDVSVSQVITSDDNGPAHRYCGMPAFGHEFINRIEDRRWIDEEVLFLKPGQVLLLSGKPGVGKTALVLEWANTYVREHDCSSIYLDLAEHRIDGEHVSTADALRSVVGSLLGFDEIGNLNWEEMRRAYLNYAACENLLVILDNVCDPAEIEGFITNSNDSLVVATSTFSNMSLETSRINVRVIEMFERDDSRKLLRSRLYGCAQEVMAAFEGENNNAEAKAILDYCDDYPIAITKCAEALSSKKFSLKGLSRSLQRPDAKADPSTMFTELWDELFARLPSDERVQFASLGLLTGTSIQLSTLCGLWGYDDLDDADLAAGRLVDASLLDYGDEEAPIVAKTYSAFSFVKGYAEMKSRNPDYAAEMKSATSSLARYYRQLSQCIDYDLNDDRLRLYDEVAVLPYIEQYVGQFGASDAFERERVRMLGLFDRFKYNLEMAHDLWPIADALWPMCHTHGYHGSFACVFEIAARMAEIDNRPDAFARLLMLQARCYSEAGRFAAAKPLFDQVDDLIESCFDDFSNRLIASLIEGKGTFYSKQGLHAKAIQEFEKAEKVFKLSSHGQRGVFLQELLIGKELIHKWEYDAAVERLEALLPAAQAMAKRIDEARVYHSLAEAQVGAGAYEGGLTSAARAATLFSQAGFSSKRNQCMVIMAKGLKACGRDDAIAALPASMGLELSEGFAKSAQPSLQPFLELCSNWGISFG